MTTDYNAIVDLDVRDDTDDTIIEALADNHPALMAGPRGTLHAVISFPAENLRQAALTALSVTAGATGREPASLHLMTTRDFDDGYWLGQVDTLSVQDAAELLGVTASAVRQRLAGGTLPGTRVGRDWRLPRPAIERLAAV